MFLKNKNIISKIRRSKVADYAALTNASVMPQSHTHLRTLTESLGSNHSRPQKNKGGPNFMIRLQDTATYSCG